jgi:hypothetical protein
VNDLEKIRFELLKLNYVFENKYFLCSKMEEKDIFVRFLIFLRNMKFGYDFVE